MNEKSTFWKTSITNGAILGIALIIYSVLLFIFDLSMNKSLGYINYVILLAGLIWFTKSYRDNNMGGIISYGQALGFGTMVVVFAALISGIYGYIFMKFIDPSIIDKIIALGEEEMLKRGMSDEQIEMAQSMQKNFMNPGFINIMGFVVTSIWGFVLALITSAFIKKEGDPFKTAMQETGE
ncbi:MAG: hypothetical protein A2X13_13500 [Bacteroidetes bacterium GWC2_33_15]|nr:MAG: hypothetical protein A2X10_08710 [Bacteroidetes bacterium GWA2_33_15]OFX50366.1 MAG: hypothetical protein A2X13_13500 [Bacteroidetes bacterium GWC2_33_15]OFX66717.1 MAG: hypothetical protein A2X15_08375 [Bacteroidetes bacterium GWB2_32_14]OFX69335.1 MAG: hypothetical protein A2X14_09305 [Bacteroidetes bacterium GWD2_33_33]HAN18653.1 hypothetical protein [Bacteroidales bacterium]